MLPRRASRSRCLDLHSIGQRLGTCRSEASPKLGFPYSHPRPEEVQTFAPVGSPWNEDNRIECSASTRLFSQKIPRSARRRRHRGFQKLVWRKRVKEQEPRILAGVVYSASSFLNASAMSVCETIAYLSNTLRVRQPPIFIMTPSAIPARRRLRAAVRRRSWKRRPGTPADLQALAHVSRKSLTAFPSGRV